MAKPELRRTYSTFTDNPGLNRSTQIRRDDDTIKTPSCTIYDIDNAVMSFISDIIRPEIVDNNAMIPIPVVYANAEKWTQIQSRGYMYDHNDRLMTPLIAVKRGTIAERDTLKKLDVNWNVESGPQGNDNFARNALTFRSQYTKSNRYDRFSVLQGIRPKQEIYVTSIPEFIDVSYDILIWTEYIEQLNHVVEQIMLTGGYAWGTTWKFITLIQDYSFETMSVPGEDRTVRATIPITVKGSLLMPWELHKSSVQKQYSVKKVQFNAESEVTDLEAESTGDPYLNTVPPGGYNANEQGFTKEMTPSDPRLDQAKQLPYKEPIDPRVNTSRNNNEYRPLTGIL